MATCLPWHCCSLAERLSTAERAKEPAVQELMARAKLTKNELRDGWETARTLAMIASCNTSQIWRVRYNPTRPASTARGFNPTRPDPTQSEAGRTRPDP